MHSGTCPISSTRTLTCVKVLIPTRERIAAALVMPQGIECGEWFARDARTVTSAAGRAGGHPTARTRRAGASAPPGRATARRSLPLPESRHPVEVVVAAGVGPVVADIPIKRRFVPCREQADISEPVRQDAAEIFGAGVVAVYDHRKDPAGDVAGIRPSRELQRLRVLGILATDRCRVRVAAGLSRSSMQPATRMRVAPDERAGTEFPNAGR